MVTIWKVISSEGELGFTDRAEANRYFYALRAKLVRNEWRHVKMVAVEVEDTDDRPDCEFSCDSGWEG